MHGDLTIFYIAEAVLMLWGCFKECLTKNTQVLKQFVV